MLASERGAPELADQIHGIRQGGQQRSAVLAFARCVQSMQSDRMRNFSGARAARDVHGPPGYAVSDGERFHGGAAAIWNADQIVGDETEEKVPSDAANAAS